MIVGLSLPLVAAVGNALGDNQEVPKDLIFSNIKFIQILNSQNNSLMGTLERPDLSEKEATEAYLKINPGLLMTNSPEPLPANSRYLSFGYRSISSNVWLVQYGHVEASPGNVNALWVCKKGLWYLIGFGWPESLAASEAHKYAAMLQPK